jgi:RNA polymerase sigma-70 factor, ECF subfamily
MNPSAQHGDKPAMTTSDEDLAAKAASGDDRAFLELYRRHRRYVLTLVVRTSGRPEDAEDLLQECFFQLHRSLSSFSGRSAFRTWFHGIAVRVCHSATRNRLAQRRRGDADAEHMDEERLESEAGGDGRDLAEQHALRDWIQGCLDKMDLMHRVPLVLHLYSGLELSDIGRILSIPEGSVKSRLFHARKRMALCLGQREDA